MRAGASWCWLQEITLVFSSTQMPGGWTDLVRFYRRLSVGRGWQLVTKLHVCCRGFVYWGNATTGSMTGLRLYCALAVVAFKITPLLLVFPKDWKRKCEYVYISNVLSQHIQPLGIKLDGKKAPEFNYSQCCCDIYFKIRLINPFLIPFFDIYRVE